MEVKVVIVGAGVGGLTAGIALKQQLGFHNFKIFEQSNDIGGTWHDNTYPGCGSDGDAHWYSLSSDPNPYWETSHASQPAIKAYWKRLATKYSLHNQLVLNRRVVSVDWNNKRQLYKVQSEDVKTKEVFFDEAQAVISAIGILCVPHYPAELSSIEAFEGEHFHSARWDHSVDLHNKRVAVIGNSCSACVFSFFFCLFVWYRAHFVDVFDVFDTAQIVPAITEDPTTRVINFCRTPFWYLRGERTTFSTLTKWIFAHVPFVMRTYRMWIMARQELVYQNILSGTNKSFRIKTKKLLEQYIKEKAPAQYHDKLIPKYTFGCKRLVVDTGYLAALHRPNLDLNFDGIDHFTGDGIVTKTDDRLSFDAIILATGFVVDRYPLKVRGIQGITVQEYYDSRDGPEAYLGVAIPGFPNFYMLAGPNTTTGHASVIFTEEVQVNYILKLINPIIQHHATSIEITTQATNTFNNEIQEKLSTSVWSSCVSWYHVGYTGKVFTQWPGTMTAYWWKMRKPVWGDYKMMGRMKGRRRWWWRGWWIGMVVGTAWVWRGLGFCGMEIMVGNFWVN